MSPIGVMDVDDADERYIDLINGPQDHGWCMGYTCQKRLSTFPIVFAASKLRRLLSGREFVIDLITNLPVRRPRQA